MMEKMMGQGPMGDMMTEMMPKYISMKFGMLEPADRKDLAEKMLGQMQEELKKQSEAPEGGSGNDEQKGGS